MNKQDLIDLSILDLFEDYESNAEHCTISEAFSKLERIQEYFSIYKFHNYSLSGLLNNFKNDSVSICKLTDVISINWDYSKFTEEESDFLEFIKKVHKYLKPPNRIMTLSK